MNNIRIRLFLTAICLILLSTASYAAAQFERYGLSLCGNSQYRCISVKPHESWFKLFPNLHEREVVMRVNRTNMALSLRRWLVIPKHLNSVNYMSLSPFPKHRDTKGKKLLYVDLGLFAFAAYNKEGNLVYWGPATSGKDLCVNDVNGVCHTATGHFHVYRIQGADCESSKYPLATNGGAPMPYCMHYFRGFAIHGSTLLGFNNRSKGCIRLFNSDARWLNLHFVSIGTNVFVQQ